MRKILSFLRPHNPLYNMLVFEMNGAHRAELVCIHYVFPLTYIFHIYIFPHHFSLIILYYIRQASPL